MAVEGIWRNLVLSPDIEERPVFFPSGPMSLAGVLSVPTDPNGLAVLIPWGAGAYPSSGRNRIRARLARALTTRGFHTLRFDYRGVGESDGDYQKPNLAKPHSEDILAACDWLDSQGFNRLLIVANCFGGWSSLAAAPRIKGLEGVALVNAPVRRDHKQVAAVDRSWWWMLSRLWRIRLKKLRAPERRAHYRRMVAEKVRASAGAEQHDDRFTRGVRHLLDRRIPVLFLYGKDDFRIDLETELERGLQGLIDEAGPTTRLAMVEERLVGFPSFEAQDALLETVLPWVDELLEKSVKG